MGWYSDNSVRRYPISDWLPPSPLVRPHFAAVDLPTEVIVDAGFLFGPLMAFDPAAGTTYLASISRSGYAVTFVIRSTSTFENASLIFTRHLGDPDWTTSWAEATNPTGGALTNIPCGAAFIWRGFLVTGDLSALEAVLPDGQTLTGGTGVAFEPTLAQSLRDDFVQSISIANGSRLTAAPPGLPAPLSPEVFSVQQQCLIGDIRIYAGFNATVDQTAASNALAIGAATGAGAGQACEEVPSYPGETPPAGSPFLTGGPPCSDLILAVNGLSSSAINIVGGEGVTVEADPANPHGIIVDLTGG